MAWDTEGTKQKILDAAVAEFAQRGPDGTTVERIARVAGVNKERVYNYFGGKQELFARVLRDELARVARDVPIDGLDAAGLGDYAGRVYDYHREHPELSRLMRWEGLTFDSEVPDEELRRVHYGYKTAAVEAGQQSGALTSEFEADQLMFLVLALAGWWSAVPQVARMITGPESPEEHARRRASVVRAAEKLAATEKPSAAEKLDAG